MQVVQKIGVGDYVNRLELVLANGDLIETTRISKHELNKKMGLQTFEGEIYRKIDGIIEDNKEFIANKIAMTAQLITLVTQVSVGSETVTDHLT